MATLGDVLKRARGERSQSEIAEQLGYTQPLIAKWEANKCAPALGESARIAEVYGISDRRLRALIIERIESRGAA